MTARDFRRLALGMSGAMEAEHMGHPDFRANGKVFATLGYPDSGWGMVKLTPEQRLKNAADEILGEALTEAQRHCEKSREEIRSPPQEVNIAQPFCANIGLHVR